MTLATYFGLQRYGWLAYHLVIVVVVHLVAIASWHFIEKPAMSLKDWTPSWMSVLLRRAAPASVGIKRRIVNPDFSSTRFAEALRSSEGGRS
jgi:peptidoglycan/LPS O-acetylase OafA/YrhL